MYIILASEIHKGHFLNVPERQTISLQMEHSLQIFLYSKMKLELDFRPETKAVKFLCGSL